ncbi:MAG: amino acid permease [Acidobacteriia bacterium]|nr:amino acid permease [Terriglobia bacterium]
MAQPTKLVRRLSLTDSVLLLAGGIIGSGIFLTAQDIALNTRRPWLFLGVWAIGMVITLLACFAFAEMGAMFPEAGGQYVYMREAYGEFVAFLYGWMIFTVSNGGTIAALAAGFALYVGSLLPSLDINHAVLTLGPMAYTQGHRLITLGPFALTRGHLVAITAIAFQTAMNVFGLRWGAILQNIATWMKFAAIAAFVVLGLAIGHGSWGHYSATLPATSGSPSLFAGVGVALIAVFWAFDGWVYITWISGEVKDPQRNLPRSLVLGLLIVGVIYLAINAVYLYALPMSEIGAQTAVAQAAAVSMFSPGAARWLSFMIAVSCFGAMASCVMSGARVYYAMADDGVFFRTLANVHPRWRTPVSSLVLQAIWAAALTLSGKYDELFTYVMFMMVLSYMLTVAALFVLRRKLPDAERPYRCAGYPWLPGLYILLAGVWAWYAVAERPKEAIAGVVIVLAGVPFYLYWRWRKKKHPAAEALPRF